jgi:hypothetical protein
MSVVPAIPHAIHADWHRLAEGSGQRRDRFTAELIAGLPEPARRWLTHAITPRAELAQSIELTMRGEIRLGSWRQFTARQILTPPTGFIWAATARVAGLQVTGFDRYSFGSGEMRWRLLGLIPVMTGSGADVTRSAGGRLAAEGIVLLPTAFRRPSWTAGPSPDTAVATWHIGDQDEAVHLRIGADGRLLEVLLQRWGNPGGQPYGRYPFGVMVQAERTFAGVTIPSSLTAGWWWGTDRQQEGEFFRAQITAASFS